MPTTLPDLELTLEAGKMPSLSRPAQGLEAANALFRIRRWFGRSQLAVLNSMRFSEERQFFYDKIAELDLIIGAMPETYETNGEGENAVAWLRYFAGGRAAFYITEKDKGSPDDTPEDFQSQMHGRADLYGAGGELGYISLPEILAAGAELDFHWEPKELWRIKG